MMIIRRHNAKRQKRRKICAERTNYKNKHTLNTKRNTLSLRERGGRNSKYYFEWIFNTLCVISFVVFFSLGVFSLFSLVVMSMFCLALLLWCYFAEFFSVISSGVTSILFLHTECSNPSKE
jgi:glucan phosphoethanolaminetransferase (alkaline phosphatase superfamily)